MQCGLGEILQEDVLNILITSIDFDQVKKEAIDLEDLKNRQDAFSKLMNIFHVLLGFRKDVDFRISTHAYLQQILTNNRTHKAEEGSLETGVFPLEYFFLQHKALHNVNLPLTSPKYS